MTITTWYLYQSGFAVDTGAHFLIFDYWRSSPRGRGLESGVIDPAALADRDVIVFVSHRHGDHYNPEILHWVKTIPKLRLVLSNDIPAAPGALMIGPREVATQPDFAVETFVSTDEGVGFLIDIDGLRIYHAGDLNWWHWAGESAQYNADMAANYKSQIDLLGGTPIDLAFVPVDPRLEAAYARGIDYLMRTADVRRAVPMHFGDHADVMDRLLADPLTADYRDRILPLPRRGQTAVFDAP